MVYLKWVSGNGRTLCRVFLALAVWVLSTNDESRSLGDDQASADGHGGGISHSYLLQATRLAEQRGDELAVNVRMA